MHHPTDRIAHTTAFVTPVTLAGMRNTCRSTMKDRSGDSSHHERTTLLPRSYISIPAEVYAQNSVLEPYMNISKVKICINNTNEGYLKIK